MFYQETKINKKLIARKKIKKNHLLLRLQVFKTNSVLSNCFSYKKKTDNSSDCKSKFSFL